MFATGRSTKSPETVPRRPAAPVKSAPTPHRRTSLAGDLIRLARPGQWPKNLLVSPLAFLDATVWTAAAGWRMLVTVATFTVASVMVYVVNDIFDRHRDREHPAKRSRPIASGRISVPFAWGLAIGLAALLCALLALSSPVSWWPVLTYLAINAAYNWRIRHVAVLDAFAVAAGFVLRLVAGYIAVDVMVSGWLLVCVLSLCLMMTFGKRRNELAVAGNGHRPALRGYSPVLVDQLILFTAVVTVAAFLMYVHNAVPAGAYEQVLLILSALFALIGVFRYLQLVTVHSAGGDPVGMVRDRVILGASTLWAIAWGVALVAGDQHRAWIDALLHRTG
ncbi:decaprenyl-phosphate phosphoribosyltransferase [Actinomadura miaoliensis]|uniref:Decaprenyl-phosphate phosphoribosyltransferase n=2 Tax=Actinomadura TaxID=1988 RepID=A0ABP7WRN6_9ACTN